MLVRPDPDEATVFTPPPGVQPQSDGTLENGGIWYHGSWYANPDTLKALGWSDAGWDEFLQKNPSYGAWAQSKGEEPVEPNDKHPDGTIDTNGGIWYHGRYFSTPDLLGRTFPSSDAWRNFLNAHTGFRDWNAAYNAAHPDGPTTGPDDGTKTIPAPTDWSIVLGTLGLPADVIAQLNLIWSKAGGDSSVATPLAINYVMSTGWFKDNYPGYFTGLNTGLYGDLRGYVSYQNDVNQLYKQYYGRAATNAEVSGFLTAGKNISQISSGLQSQAMLGTIPDPLKLIFTPEELRAFTDEKAGIDSALGQKMLAQVNTYMQISPLFKSFYGRAPTRTELDTLVANGTDPSQVAQQFKASGYLDAISPVLKGIFDPSELQMMAAEAAGGDTQHGKQLLDMASLATSLNEVYLIHSGKPLTREELNNAYSQGYTSNYVDRMLSSGEFAGALPENVRSLFTADELRAAGAQATGASSSAAGGKLLNLVKGAGDYARLATQYGQPLARDQLEGYFNTGFSANDYGSQLAGQSWAAANSKEIQQAAGSFGEGQFTPDQLGKLGAEKAGLDTPEGAKLLAIYQRSIQRMNGTFAGVLARSGSFSNTEARKSITSASSDVSA